jgi:hypothetical protein
MEESINDDGCILCIRKALKAAAQWPTKSDADGINESCRADGRRNNQMQDASKAAGPVAGKSRCERTKSCCADDRRKLMQKHRELLC